MKKSMHNAIVILAALTVISSTNVVRAGWPSMPKPIRNTPVDPGTWNPGKLMPRPQSTSSHLGRTWTTEYYIQGDGSIIQRSVSDDNGKAGSWRRASNRRATLQHSSKGSAYWVYRGAKNSPRYASQWNRRSTLSVDPNNGSVYVKQYHGNKYVGRSYRGKASSHFSNGRHYWAYNGRRYASNRQPQRPPQPQYPNPPQPQYPTNYGQNNQDIGLQILGGLLQGLTQASQQNGW